MEERFGSMKSTEEAIVLSPSQEELRQQIQTHVQIERKAGSEINPARPQQISTDTNNGCSVAERCELIELGSDSGWDS